MSVALTVALSKGRILTEALPLLARIGIRPLADPATSRKLVQDTSRAGVRLVIVRAADVPTYVEHGAADLGIAGKDVLLENGGDVYEPLDLGLARCRLMLAGPKDAPEAPTQRLRVATKYVNVTRGYFAARGMQVEIIRLYGSMELAPLLGLADRIVDLVDTGNTLRANGLVPLATIAEITARLIVNKAAMKLKPAVIKPLIRELSAAAGQERA